MVCRIQCPKPMPPIYIYIHPILNSSTVICPYSVHTVHTQHPIVVVSHMRVICHMTVNDQPPIPSMSITLLFQQGLCSKSHVVMGVEEIKPRTTSTCCVPWSGVWNWRSLSSLGWWGPKGEEGLTKSGVPTCWPCSRLLSCLSLISCFTVICLPLKVGWKLAFLCQICVVLTLPLHQTCSPGKRQPMSYESLLNNSTSKAATSPLRPGIL